jgi:hypothetical protein
VRTWGTPLYAVYAKQFDFSGLTLTTIFATYAAVLVPRRTSASSFTRVVRRHKARAPVR